MRLIDADAFIQFLKDAVKSQKYENLKIDEILTVADVINAVISDLDGTSLDGFKNAPTIELQPDIIRCKECKHWKDSDGVYRRGIGAESKCPVNIRAVYEGNFYCADAKRKEGETDGM